MKKALILLTAAALLLTACAGSGNPSSEGSSQQSSQPSPEAAPVTAEELIEPVGGVWPSDHRGLFITFEVQFRQ